MFVSSVWLLALCVFFSVQWAGFAERLYAASTVLARYEARKIAKFETEELVGRLAQANLKEPFEKRLYKDYVITHRPLSDAINVNYARKEVFDKTMLHRTFAQGMDARKLQQFRFDEGIALDVGHYANFFDNELFEHVFTLYGWANWRLLDEFSAEKIGGTELRNLVQKHILRGSLTEVEKEKYFPLVNDLPLININYADPIVIREILVLNGYARSRAESAVETIVSMREQQHFDEASLRRFFNMNKNDGLAAWFGADTWFWEIVIENGRYVRRSVYCYTSCGEKGKQAIIIEDVFNEKNDSMAAE